MTILHSVALAGGIEHQTAESWQAIEAVREVTKVEHARSKVIRMLARLAALRAERNGTPVEVPARLVQILGNVEATAIVKDEIALRSLVVGTRRAREAALRTGVDSAKSEVALAKERINPLESNIKLRTERLNAMLSLGATGAASKAQIVEIQTALLEVEGRRQDALAGIDAAKHRLELAQEEFNRFVLENATQIEFDITEADKEIAENITAMESGKKTLLAIQANLVHQIQTARSGTIMFEIIRKTPNGTKIIPAQEISELEPGDLVKVMTQSINEQELVKPLLKDIR
jgi:hypothetical protein